MGLIKKLITKTIVSNVTKNLRKDAKIPQNIKVEQAVSDIKNKVLVNAPQQGKSEQVISLIKYQKNNINLVVKQINELQQETNDLIEKIKLSQSGNVRLSIKDRIQLRNCKDQAQDNLRYLYALNDYFIFANKLCSGLTLSDDQLSFILKFYPFFEGRKVLSEFDDEDDDSLLGAVKDLGTDLKEMLIGSKKKEHKFDIHDYLSIYEEKIEKLKLPDIDTNLSIFVSQCNDVNIMDTSATIIVNEIECPGCKRKLPSGTKFCPSCGSKIEIVTKAFCVECGAQLEPNAKFCAECGHKCNN